MKSRTYHLVTTRARAVLLVSLLLAVVAAIFGAGAIGKLKTGGFDSPSFESARANAALVSTLHQQQANLVLLVTAPAGSTVDSPAVAARAKDVTQRLTAQPGVTILDSYWTAPAPVAAGLRSTDGGEALIAAKVSDADDRVKELAPLFSDTADGVRIDAGGIAQANLDINNQVTKDLGTAESIAIPLTLALLVVVFGSVVAGLLPLLVGGIAIVGTFAALGIIAALTDVSIFALNLTTAMGLGLGIDYALLMVSRFREELGAGLDTRAAVGATLRTAGRTVLFSAATIASALAALLVFPLYFLRSFAYAGIVVVAIAAAASLLTLPALLSVLGPRVNKLRVRRRPITSSTSAFWSNLARFVMRRPVLSAVPVVVILLGMGLPFLRADFGLPDDRVIPAAQSQARVVGDALRSDFASQGTDALTVVLPAVDGSVPDYALSLSRLPDVSRVDSAAGTFVAGAQVGPGIPALTAGTASALRVIPAVDPYSDQAQDLVRAVRAVDAPGDRLVGGPSAELVDVKKGIADRLPLAAGLIALTTFILLFLFTGSVVLPLKALVINALTIGGVIGAMAWIFQQGHLSGLLGFTPTPLTITMPLLMFCVAFGLSMDYEVFLLGRITEQHRLGADTATAVAVGLERIGRIVTTAAVLLAITFFAFVSSKVSFIQMFGLGSGLAIVLDATLVRGILVPALMRLMGPVNWWAPGPLRRLHNRIGLSEAATETPARVPVTV